MRDLDLDLPALQPGWVWLVGAGPGDPGLLTLSAWQALRQAEVVVHDALVSKAVLRLACPTAELENAGKRGGRPSPRQDEISERLVRHARAGKRVVRLKGGDPFVFGRGGEEALSLVAAGVPFRIVPGVPAGIGGLAHAGIPVTHREIAPAVTFLTGHDVDGAVPGRLDWPAIARGSPVIVVYMGLTHLATITERLIAGGRRPEEPVAVVRAASMPEQRVLETTLGRAAADVAEAGLKAPAMVAIGEVVRLRAGLDWLGALSGRTLDAQPLRGSGSEDG